MIIELEPYLITNPIVNIEKYVTPRRRQILQLLAQYRFLTTLQLHSLLQPDREIKRTWEELDRLRKLGMIKGVSIEPEKGIYGQYCWLLLLRGARAIEFKEYGNYYRRKPGPQSIFLRTMELILEKQVQNAGVNSVLNWKLEKPRSLKNQNQKTQHHKSIQFQILATAINWKEQVQTGQKPVDAAGFQTLCIPPNANDYVAYTVPEGHLAVVLVLPPQRVSEKFWRSRIEKYQELAKELPVVGVFEDEKQALAYKPMLNPYQLRLTTINRVSMLLDAIARAARSNFDPNK
jgi:hypothetical protein